MRFDDKVVVLTGVGRAGQAGETVARAFAELGASVVAVARKDGEVTERVQALRDAGFRADGFPCDLTDEAQVRVLAEDVTALHGGRVDALINIAGGFAMSGPVADSHFGEWQRQFAINLTTAYLTTRAFLPLVRPARGSIVYFASAAALPGARTAQLAAYSAAKSGVVALMRAVADEERPNGVRANALAPTAIRTATNLESIGDKVRYVEREAVAEAVCFLCSEGAGAITGQTIVLS